MFDLIVKFFVRQSHFFHCLIKTYTLIQSYKLVKTMLLFKIFIKKYN